VLNSELFRWILYGKPLSSSRSKLLRSAKQQSMVSKQMDLDL